MVLTKVIVCPNCGSTRIKKDESQVFCIPCPWWRELRYWKPKEEYKYHGERIIAIKKETK